MKPSVKIGLALIFFTPGLFAAGQGNASPKWTVNPFAQKVFIENKGQFPDEGNNRVLYKVEDNGIKILFTSSGLLYTNIKAEEPGKNNLRARKFDEEEEAEMSTQKAEVVSESVRMEWAGCNPETQIIAENRAPNYFTYPDAKKRPNTIRAFAYKKIIYKNLYPNIDVEYFFPDNKPGFKYNLILHPGADVSRIKIKYSGIKSLTKNGDGNLIIETPFSIITDHAPKSYYGKGENIISAFSLTGENTVGFNLTGLDQGRETVIDPWTTVTAFSGVNKAFDVNYDNNGNVYVYGGSYPFELIKMNSQGVIRWTYTASDFDSDPATNSRFYGDFAVDEEHGISYVCEAAYLINGARIAKVDSMGNQVGFFGGSQNLEEMWRMVYDPCTKTIVIGGGGISHPYQASILDTSGNMGITPVNVLNATSTFRDMALLAADGYGNCFMLSSKSSDNLYNNLLFKLPFPTLTPMTYSVPSGHSFLELKSVKYMPTIYQPPANGNPASNVAGANGYNGIAASRNYVYTYNGFTLKKWENATGNFVKASNIAGNQICRSGGISVDACDDLYVGSSKSIKVYDDSLNVLNTIALDDTVYDVKLDDKNDILYACGKGFVASISVPNASCLKLSFTSTETCYNTGTATVDIVSGGVPPYSYTWNLTPVQTTSRITDLLKGTYSVSVTDNSCLSVTNSGTVYVPPVKILFSLDSVANVFTPNGDGNNDMFNAFFTNPFDMGGLVKFLKSYHLKIYDRWGILVYETDQYQNGWKGEDKKGNTLPEGIYFWLADFSSLCDPPDNNPVIKAKGYVHLYR